MLARAPQYTDNSSVWHLDHRARGVESKCAWGSWVSRMNKCRHVHHKIWEDLLQIYRRIDVQVHMSLAIMCTFICACMSTFLYTCMMVCTWVCVCLYSYTHTLSLSLSLCCLPIHSPRAAGPLRPVQKKKWIWGNVDVFVASMPGPSYSWFCRQTALYQLRQRCTSISNTEVQYVKFSTGRVD